MSEVAQVVAAVSGGALIAISAMLVIRFYGDHQRAVQQRKIEAAVRTVLCGVEEAREKRSRPPTASPAQPAAGGRAEARGARHLRLVTRPPRGRNQPAPSMRAERSVRASGR